MRCPGGLVLDHHQPLQCAEILARGVVLHGPVRAARVPGERRRRGESRDIARKTREQPCHSAWVPTGRVDPTNIYTGNLLQVVANGQDAVADAEPTKARPSADRHLVDDVGESQPRIGTWARVSLQQLFERYAP